MLKKRNSLILISLLCLSQILSCRSYAWSGKVVSIADGDTIKALHNGKQEKIRYPSGRIEIRKEAKNSFKNI